MSDPPRVSVVVPAHDAERTLEATLDALAVQEVAGGFEVLVVDAASTDDTRAVAERRAATDPRFRVLVAPDREPGAARNLGAAAARGTWLFFTDADCEPERLWLRSGLEALDGAELVQGRVLPVRPPGPWDRTLSVGAEAGLYETANLMMRREVLDRAGGFAPLPGYLDERPFGEDTLFAWRARRAGVRTAFAPAAVVRHVVVERPASAWVAEQRRRGHFAWLVREVPELRSRFLFGRVFLSRGTASFDAAVVSVLTAVVLRRPALLAGAVPYLAGVRHPARVAGDAVGLVALVRSSVAARTLVL